MKNLAVVAVGLAVAGGVASAQGQAPATDTHAAAKAKAPIYDEDASGAALIDAAIAKAARNNRRVLVQWGANWCPWCHVLHGTMGTDKDLKHELLYEYDVVLVDVGRFDKNLDVAGKYGAKVKESGIPYLTILDGSGKVVENQETSALESKEPGVQAYNTPAVMKFLKGHEAAPRAAEDVLKDGLSRARTADKRAFVHFGAPWCPWCHRLEDWMEKPEIAALLGKDFADVKIDTDRDTGGADVMARLNPAKNNGIPWFAFLDAEGKVLSTSNSAAGNIGYPGAAEEIEHFVGMLRGAAKNLTAADIAAVEESLRKSAPAGH